MNSLENVIRFESASSGIAFRKSLYEPAEDAAAIVDCLSLANADLARQRRYLFIGVDDDPAGRRRIPGVDRTALAAFKKRLLALVEDFIEPSPSIDVRGIEIDGRVVGVVRLKDCTGAPYLTKRPVGRRLPAGVGFVRRGARNMSLTRNDMQRMFANQPAHRTQPVPLKVGFPQGGLADRICLPVLGLQKLPSQIAAERIRGMLAARDKSRSAFGRTETQFHRLIHARYCGADTPFEEHSDESLMISLSGVEADNQVADEHYKFEVRAHRIGLVIANRGDTDFHDARLRLSIQRIPGIGVADRVYAESLDAPVASDYPHVTKTERKICIETDVGTLKAGAKSNAFREAPRFWARKQAASRTVLIDYELSADELDAPASGSLFIDIEPESLRSV